METTSRSSVSPTSGATVSLSVIEWRRRRLIASGFEPLMADQVAHAKIDLHELLALLDRGCPPHLAVQILAPVEPMELPSLGPNALSPVSPWPPNSTKPPIPRGRLA